LQWFLKKKLQEHNGEIVQNWIDGS